MVGCIPIFNACYQIQISNLNILVYQLINLTVGQLRIAIKVFIGSIDNVKEFTPFATIQQFLTCELTHLQVVAFAYHLGNLMELVRDYLRNLDLIFHIVIVLLKASQLFNMLLIVGIIIIDVHGGILIEAFNE